MSFVSSSRAASGACQDRVCMRETGDGLVLVVADGAGGIGGGAEAAESAMRQVVELSNSLKTANDCHRLLARVDASVAAEAHGGETTLVLAVVRPGEVIGASVGDSSAWIINSTAVDDLTASQQRKPLIGSGRACPASFVRMTTPQATLLLATDGLTKYAPIQAIHRAVSGKAPDQVTELLHALVCLPSGDLHDDVSFIIGNL